ncbi:MAG: MerR family DNA-binding protein [Candidatus Omnitrophica bacterium]|nr:MerR family DNA-binding protein [Candidatus Omnitrophota bacterium]
MEDGSLFIRDVAKRSGCSTHAIRFYEKQGLLDRTQRTTSGYRVYELQALDRLAFIRKAQRLGFNLEEIRDIFVLSQRGRPCPHVRQLATQKLAELDQQIRESLVMKRELERLVRDWKRASKQAGRSICPHIERFIPSSAVRRAGARNTRRRR